MRGSQIEPSRKLPSKSLALLVLHKNPLYRSGIEKSPLKAAN